MTGACTIISPNYFAYARTLAASYMAHHPGHRFFVLIVADLTESAAFQDGSFTPVMLGEIGLADVRREAMKYDLLELNTNVKPTFLKHLLARYGLEQVVYLDPDICVYGALTPVFAALAAGASAVLTPHITEPYPDAKKPSEQDHLYNGTYNLGFVALRRCDEADRLLTWWEQRCLEEGFSEGRTGLFVDQKWMNLTPGLFAGIAILRHTGCNMAYWNLHERTLSEVDGNYVVNGTEPLCFFHFSGIVVADPEMLSKNTNRYKLAERPDLQRIFAEYKRAILGNKDATAEAQPYGFNVFDDGTAVTLLARRIYAVNAPRFAGTDAFAADGAFLAFAKRLRLVGGKSAPPKATWREFSGTDRRVEMVHRLLKTGLRVLGPHRYELLMRYLSYIAVLRNQSVFLNDE